MKRIKLTAATFLALGVIALTPTGCKKEGTIGPAGANGANGTNGTNGAVISPADQAAYDAANGINGGLAFNKFWATETGFPQPVDIAITGKAAFFQCTACHGRDLLGTSGGYINRAPSATRPNVATYNLRAYGLTHNIKEIFNAVKNTGGRTDGTRSTNSLNSVMPDYGKLLTDGLIWDMVKFLKSETVNNDALYDLTTTGTYPTGIPVYSNIGKTGDAAAGAAWYQAKCASCHTANGTTIPGSTEHVGAIIRDEPFWIFYQLKFGRPGTAMQTISTVGNITITEGQNLYKAMNDTLAFPW